MDNVVGFFSVILPGLVWGLGMGGSYTKINIRTRLVKGQDMFWEHSQEEMGANPYCSNKSPQDP